MRWIARGLQDSTDACLVSPGQGQIAASEDGSRPRLSIELLCRQLPPLLAGERESVAVRVEAVVQSAKRLRLVMRLTDRGVPEMPQEVGLFGVLREDRGDDGHVVRWA